METKESKIMKYTQEEQSIRFVKESLICIFLQKKKKEGSNFKTSDNQNNRKRMCRNKRFDIKLQQT